MCRFVAYLGSEPLLLSRILQDPCNSLIKQSLNAREDSSQIHADGFGLGWYNHSASDKPAIYRSIQPAWNDFNINHFIDKVASSCFFGHIRAATEGAVTLSNCHPFFANQYLFMHNGLIDGFYSIKIKIIQMIHPDSYQNVLGQTDSEHVFALILFFLAKSSGPLTANAYKKAIEKAIKKILSWLKDAQQLLVLNFVISNGHSLIAIRYSNHPERKKLTLYYTNHVELSAANPQAQSVIIASEKLSDVEKNWHSVPMNHFLYVGSDFKPIMKALSI